MKLLLDQGLPRTCVDELRHAGVSSIHVGEVGLSAATDTKILQFALEESLVLATLDADFHAMLAASGASGPSVIRLRVERLKAAHAAALLTQILDRCSDDLSAGTIISADATRIRVHRLPVSR